ncbi:MAG TPA: metallophosphoesterase [Gemmatimonadaceae bacterium]|nr:metallophosphoesterase [Gemmatimonadaceae bacterium]
MRIVISATALLVLTTVTGANPLPAQDSSVSGVVFVDRNGNGVRDGQEAGLGGVVVSNQDAVVLTDSAGSFRLPRGGYGVVFVSVPDGYRANGSFWRAVSDSAANLGFALSPVARRREFTFVHASDTHIAPANVVRTRRLQALIDSLRPSFLLITGDLVRDALRVPEAEATGYYELFVAERARFATPVWTVPGNHEVFGIERHRSLVSPTHPLYARGMYRHHLGPDYYSFTYGGVHFVGLNTVGIDDLWYYGQVDSVQLAWLERDLALVPAATPVVTFNHIPFFSAVETIAGYMDGPPAPSLITVNRRTTFRHVVSNAAEALAILRARPHVLALGGHVHVAERLEYEMDGRRTHFHQSAATVAPTEASGMRFTSGVTVYTVRGTEIDEGKFIPLDGGDSRARALTHAPERPQAGTSYLFYLHGRIVEDQGPSAVSPQFGRYEYEAIVRHFVDSGFTVISEVRARDTDPERYADSVVTQIRRLLAGGVRPHDVTVVGASKGSVIAMLVATRLAQPVRFVLLANCNESILRRFTPSLHGDVLSIYEASDSLGQSCRALFDQSPRLGRRHEIRLETGLQHGFLYRPLPQWVAPTVAWARSGQR